VEVGSSNSNKRLLISAIYEAGKTEEVERLNATSVRLEPFFIDKISNASEETLNYVYTS